MRIRFGSLIVVLTATVVAFLPVLQNGFVNWDDPFTLVGNPRLDAPGVVRWSFTTTEMGHYQPLAWLAWSQWKALFGLDPTAFHALSLLGHLVNVALVYVLGIRLAAMTGLTGTGAGVAAIVAAFTFAVHRVRVEAVAWATTLLASRYNARPAPTPATTPRTPITSPSRSTPVRISRGCEPIASLMPNSLARR